MRLAIRCGSVGESFAGVSENNKTITKLRAWKLAMGTRFVNTVMVINGDKGWFKSHV
jgi:hypothetical protein